MAPPCIAVREESGCNELRSMILFVTVVYQEDVFAPVLPGCYHLDGRSDQRECCRAWVGGGGLESHGIVSPFHSGEARIGDCSPSPALTPMSTTDHFERGA